MPAYKDKKTNTWYAKFNYKNWKGETKFTTKRGFSTKREAVDYENEYKLHIAGSLDMTFREFVEVYREDRYPRIRVSTSASKDHIIDTKILPYFGKLKVTDIRPKDIVKWQNELLRYRNPRTGKPYSKTYLRSVHSQMSAICVLSIKNPQNRKENSPLSEWEFPIFRKRHGGIYVNEMASHYIGL